MEVGNTLTRQFAQNTSKKLKAAGAQQVHWEASGGEIDWKMTTSKGERAVVTHWLNTNSWTIYFPNRQPGARTLRFQNFDSVFKEVS